MNPVHMIYVDQRAYGGLLGTDEQGAKLLEDGVEFHLLANPQNGSIGVNAIKLGRIFIPEDAMVIELGNESPYAMAFRSVVANLKLM